MKDANGRMTIVVSRALLVCVVSGWFTVTGSVVADEATGKIENIDPSKTLVVGDQIFTWSEGSSPGIKLRELKEGDEVKVMYDPNKRKGDVKGISKEQ